MMAMVVTSDHQIMTCSVSTLGAFFALINASTTQQSEKITDVFFENKGLNTV